jgi:tetratricopeptide (TPR) repeat protein
MVELTLTLSQAIGRAFSAYNAGKLVEAEQLCQQIINAKPDLFEVLHLLGVVQSSLGKKDMALASYDRALAVRPDFAEALSNRGIALKELKQFEEALASYDRALALRPDYAQALCNRGNTLHELKRFEEALASYDRALAVRPDYAEALSNRGLTLHELKRFDEALASYDRALTVRPDYAEALSNRGLTLRELKRFKEALTSYDRALTVRPDFAEALCNRGNTLHELKRFEEALASYDRALTARPDYADALCNRGNTLHELKRFEEALASCDRALAVRPDYAEALSNRGFTLHELKRFEEALTNYDRALTARPDYAEALSNRGNTLHELKRFEEALASYDRALIVRPDYAEALSNRGLTLHELKRFDEALASYDRALVVRPEFAEAFCNRGNTQQELKRFEEALASYDRALAVRPDYAEAHWNDALLRLLTGDFSRGWTKYEWRWKNESQALTKRNFSQPLWLGAEAIDGKAILLHNEQGFGDTIQFCRYVPLVAARGARVILEVERPLQELMTSLAGATQVISEGDPLPDFDFQCPLLSLPLAFGTRPETIPLVTPYLRAPVQALKNWPARLGSKSRPRIGLVWSGSPTHKKDQTRSISLHSLLPLLDIEATFVSLQKDVRTDDMAVLKDQSNLLHFGDSLKNFSDTAALISNLDLVISVDTSVAHLAGALAKPVWILVTYVPDWRWLLDRNDSPWYPTARLFRQDNTRAWDNVTARVHAALCEFVQCRT